MNVRVICLRTHLPKADKQASLTIYNGNEANIVNESSSLFIISLRVHSLKRVSAIALAFVSPSPLSALSLANCSA